MVHGVVQRLAECNCSALGVQATCASDGRTTICIFCVSLSGNCTISGVFRNVKMGPGCRIHFVVQFVHFKSA